jgi:hypothetical protein
LGIAPNGWSSKQLKIKEDTLTDVDGWWRETGDMEVRVVDLANRAGYARTEEVGH